MNDGIEPTAKQKQIRRVLDFMRKNGEISQREADSISVKRLAARISDMKRMGYAIGSRWVNGINQYGEKDRYKVYFLEV